ncbi:group II intron reverse transcriptase/maturase [Xenorhabdus nematophila]|uniref:group II intron reverse transcriptase/maturase n=1 Tax=Xenorhabdus nematophila TaxID=628 RepID=UPI0032B83059
MNTFKQVSAVSRPITWHTIDWYSCFRDVKRLQLRIAKASQKKQWRKAKALQRLLTRSFSAKAIAVKRVTENTGKNTPGVDGKTWNTPETKWEAITQLKRRGYKPSPLKRVYIPKANGKQRPLGIPTIKDRAMQALYLLALEPISESHADHNSYGFRPSRGTADAIEQIFRVCSRKNAARWILEGDIKGCFDNISHEWLLANIPMDKQILHKWLKAGYMEGGNVHSTIAGTPQGGIISPVLANMALDGMEKTLRKAFGKLNSRQSNRNKVKYVRYADDFVVTGCSKEILLEEVKPLVVSFMKQRGLELSREKTVVTNIDEGFDFLGQNIRKYGNKLIIKPSRKSTDNLLKKIKIILDENKTAPTWMLIAKLNPVIRGWTNYHKHVVSKKRFNYVDYQIWKKIWQWCVRRHPNKSKRWIRSKYLKSRGMRNWVFFGIDPMGKGYELLRASSTPVRRHIKIVSEAHPYDEQWESYFERRQDAKWLETQRGKNKVIAIWRNQSQICPMCGQRFTLETGWHVHHKIKKISGGGDGLDNLVLLHPNCHRKLHANEAGSPK